MYNFHGICFSLIKSFWTLFVQMVLSSIAAGSSDIYSINKIHFDKM
jgi:hypothetical protein